MTRRNARLDNTPRRPIRTLAVRARLEEGIRQEEGIREMGSGIREEIEKEEEDRSQSEPTEEPALALGPRMSSPMPDA